MTEELRLVRLKARALDAAVAAPDAARDAPEKHRLDVYANWDDVLRALEGSSAPSASALSRAVFGSAKAQGVGFSRAEQVAAIASELAVAGEADLRKRATSPPLGSGDDVGQRRADWVLEWYGHLREFYAAAAKKGMAVVCLFR